MNRMIVSGLFTLTEEGPASTRPNKDKEPQLVHLRQGDMDGACGPYCVAMALISFGLMTRNQAINIGDIDGRERLGKFRNALSEFGALVSGGTEHNDLRSLIEIFKAEGVVSNVAKGNTREVFNSVSCAIDSGQLAIVFLSWEGEGAHWALAVGYQEVERDGELQGTHLLCLDPGYDTPKTVLWNTVVEVFNHEGLTIRKGLLPSMHWGERGDVNKCRLVRAIILEG